MCFYQSLMVELRGVEPLSEKAHTTLSTRLSNIY